MDGEAHLRLAAEEAPVLTLKCIGVFQAVLSTGETVAINSMKSKALLAYLALAPGMRHTREHLAALLWDRSDHEHARASLRQAVAVLRKAFGPAADRFLVTSDPEIIALNQARIKIELTDSAGIGERAYDRTEFLASLNVRSEPFEEWRREQAARIETLAATDDQETHSLLHRSESINSTVASEELIEPDNVCSQSSDRRTSRTRNIWQNRLRNVFLNFRSSALMLAVAIAGIAYYAANHDTQGSLKVHGGQHALDLTRKAAALKAHPELAKPVERCKYDRDDPQKTIKACTIVIDAVENDVLYKAVALTVRGTAHRWEANYEPAKEDFAQAILIDPAYYNAQHGIAYTYYLTGDHERALHHYQQVKDILPTHVMAHYRTGEVYFAMGDFKKAEKAYTDTIRLSPDFAYAYFYRAQTRGALGKIDQAKEDLRLAASINSSLRTEAQSVYASLAD
ncbi:tetratricopeptide repeat protein [Hyphococcus flavus]|uniref:Tetratricopeptide repeat protein n=1 Tax=Hyphococcus flavus TaxID=1866326 RepID=A0AAE9ZC49_9PROT|nr:tetratricopeptide repeat protein [Hyphococcus flavus]WDI30710.1 tetratricopeptide repeat protein [Hyphococcus flavus]